MDCCGRQIKLISCIRQCTCRHELLLRVLLIKLSSREIIEAETVDWWVGSVVELKAMFTSLSTAMMNCTCVIEFPQVPTRS